MVICYYEAISEEIITMFKLLVVEDDRELNRAVCSFRG